MRAGGRGRQEPLPVRQPWRWAAAARAPPVIGTGAALGSVVTHNDRPFARGCDGSACCVDVNIVVVELVVLLLFADQGCYAGCCAEACQRTLGNRPQRYAAARGVNMPTQRCRHNVYCIHTHWHLVYPSYQHHGYRLHQQHNWFIRQICS